MQFPLSSSALLLALTQFGRNEFGENHTSKMLANEIPDDDRIFVIEDTADVKIKKPQVISAELELRE